MRLGDSGFRIVLDTRVDLTSATTFIIRLVRPDGSSRNVPADQSSVVPAVAPATKPTRVFYQIQPGDLTISGIYTFEVINNSGGMTLTSDPVEIYVGAAT